MNHNAYAEEVNEITKLFHALNAKFYNHELKDVVITIQHQSRGNGILGWCTVRPIWSGEDLSATYFEINITAEALNRSYEEIAATLLHEMAHLFNIQNNVQDCSRGGYYHNTEFKKTAEAHGLAVQKDPMLGWHNTTLNLEGKTIVDNIKPINYKPIARQPALGRTGRPKGKSNSIKHTCPSCGFIARSTKPGKLICGLCNKEMEAGG